MGDSIEYCDKCETDVACHLNRGCLRLKKQEQTMKPRQLSETAQAYKFRYGTTYMSPEGIEVAIVAKSPEDVEAIWRKLAPCKAFDRDLVQEVEISRRD